ncbi:MAG: transposase, partial [Gammaproteobacteria bacterium]|nr:transposase [Gammaproteobacteria bacterium]
MVCWDHARRKFVDAVKAMPAKDKRSNKVSKADVDLSKIRKLYAIEKQKKKLTPEERQQQRQEQSIPVLDDFKLWLEKNISKLPKDSLTYTAI